MTSKQRVFCFTLFISWETKTLVSSELQLHPDFSSSQEGYQTELSCSIHGIWKQVLHQNFFFFTWGIFAAYTSGKVQSCLWEEGVKLGSDNPPGGMWYDLRPAHPLCYKRTMNLLCGCFNESVKSAAESYDMQKGSMKSEIKHRSLYLRYAVQPLYRFCFGGHYDWRTSTSGGFKRTYGPLCRFTLFNIGIKSPQGLSLGRGWKHTGPRLASSFSNVAPHDHHVFHTRSEIEIFILMWTGRPSQDISQRAGPCCCYCLKHFYLCFASVLHRVDPLLSRHVHSTHPGGRQ